MTAHRTLRFLRLIGAVLIVAGSGAALSSAPSAAAPRPEGLAAATRACGAPGGGQLAFADIPIATCTLTVDAPGRIFINASASLANVYVGPGAAPTLLTHFDLLIDGAPAAQSARDVSLIPDSTRSLNTQTAVMVTAGSHTLTLQGRVLAPIVAPPVANAAVTPAAISAYFIPTDSNEKGCASPTVASISMGDEDDVLLAECSINLAQPMTAQFSASADATFTGPNTGIETRIVVDGVDLPITITEGTRTPEDSGPFATGVQGSATLSAGIHVVQYVADEFIGDDIVIQPSIMVTAAPTGSEDVKRCQGPVSARFRSTSAAFEKVADSCDAWSTRPQLVQITAIAQLLGNASGDHTEEFQLMIDGVLQTDTTRSVSLYGAAAVKRTMTTQVTRSLSPGPHSVTLHARRASGTGTPDVNVASVSIRVVTDIPVGGGSTDYVPVVPDRVLDTRPGVQVGYTGGKPRPGDTVQLQVTGTGTSQVPNSAGAVVLNVTGTEADAAGFVTIWPCGTERPTASNLNLQAGGTAPNLVVAKIGTGGKVCLFTQSGAHLIADVNGYMPSTSWYTSVVPERLLDTRTGAKPAPGDTVEVQVAGAGVTNVPLNAKAVVLNVTATEADAAGFVTVWPCGTPRPTASNLNIPPGGTAPNLVVSKIGTGGKVCIFVQAGMHLIADVNGYMPFNSSYVSVVPERLLETRSEGQVGYTGDKPVAGATVELTVIGTGVTNVAVGTKAVVLNVTGIEPDADGFVTVWPCGAPRLTASNLNLTAGGIRPNLVMSQVGAGGKVCIFTQSSTHLIADISGFWP
jgi:hypothetical protein